MHIIIDLGNGSTTELDIDDTDFKGFTTTIALHIISTASSRSDGPQKPIEYFEYVRDGFTPLRDELDYVMMREWLSNNFTDSDPNVHLRAVYDRPEFLPLGQSDRSSSSDKTKSHDVSPMETGFLTREFNPLKIHYDNLTRLEELGNGAFGSVYKVYDEENDLIMAMKVIRTAGSNFEDHQEEIMREIENSRKCHSPYIIKFCAALFIEDSLGVCFEFMDGRSVDRFGAMPNSVLRASVACIIRGLLYLWGTHRIMHRDLKPSNVLANSSGAVKLCDFGVSRELQNTIKAHSYVGTSLYMAPEKLRGEPYTETADYWSLGITVLEMALGHYPFEWEQSADINVPLIALDRKLPDIESLLCNVEADMRNLVKRCLKPDPVERIHQDSLNTHPVNQGEINHEEIAVFVTQKLKL